MRSLISFGVTVICLAMVGTGLFMTFEPVDEVVVLRDPGTPGRLVSGDSSATAFFEIEGAALELTMLFTEPDDPESVFRTRIRLMDGQSHSVVIGDPEDDNGAQRYTFVRTGDTIEMLIEPAEPMTASFTVTQ